MIAPPILPRFLLSTFRNTFALIALALLVAACGGSSQVVATISDGDLYDIEISSQQVEDLSSNSGAISTTAFAEDLTNTIVEFIVIERASADFGITVTSDDIEARRAELQDSVEAQGTAYQDFLDQQGFTDERVRRIAHQQLVAEAVEAQLLDDEGPVTDEQIDAYVDRTVRGSTEVCASHILLETEDEAVAARERVLAGEDFAAVAMDVSTGPSGPDGGDLGCTTLGSYVEEFAIGAYEAEIGVPTEPVRSSFGWHVILVTERTAPEDLDLEQVRDNASEVLNSTRGQPLVNEWLLRVIGEAQVSVEPEYGSWVTDPQPQVLPPA